MRFSPAKYDTLIVSRAANWLTIELNRPKTRNALSNEMVDDLILVLAQTARDSSLRGVTFQGRGGVFCAGGDLKGFKSDLQSDKAIGEVKAASIKAGLLFERIATLPQVVLMLVDGAAMAGGLGMVCAGDIVAVTAKAKFALTEVTLGIPPAQIAPFVVARLGLPRAKRLMLTAARFDGAEAMEIGLADYVVADAAGFEQVEAEVQAAVRRAAPGANAITKNIALATQFLPPNKLRDLAAEGFAKAITGSEGREGIAAFLEKRKPNWALLDD